VRPWRRWSSARRTAAVSAGTSSAGLIGRGIKRPHPQLRGRPSRAAAAAIAGCRPRSSAARRRPLRAASTPRTSTVSPCSMHPCQFRPMPEAMLGVRPPAARRAARSPMVAWTSVRLSWKPCERVKPDGRQRGATIEDCSAQGRQEPDAEVAPGGSGSTRCRSSPGACATPGAPPPALRPARTS